MVITRVIRMVILQTTLTYDPFSLIFIILVAVAVIGLAVYLFTAINDQRNRNALTDAEVNALNISTNTYANLAQAVINAINQQTINMTNLTQAIVTAINVNTTMYQAQVQNDINFKNTLLELYGMQLTDRDIRQLMLGKNQNQSGGTK
jgi:NO-binding membrane sensor protein with MHYT domain